MEFRASWTVLTLAAMMLAGGLGFLNQAPPSAAACSSSDPFCAGPAFERTAVLLVAWSALGMALLLGIVWLGMAFGGSIIGSMTRPPGRR